MRIYKRVSIIFLCAVMLTMLAVSVRSIAKSKPVMADFYELPAIIIDPGHGGIDGGAQGNGVSEKDINLSISLMLRDMFIANGFDVIMTRDVDVSIHDPDAKSVRKQKTSDLRNRLNIVNSHSNAIFISIHQNKFIDSSCTGAQVFYSPNNTSSKDFANILQHDFQIMLQPDNNRKYKKAGKNLYLMYNAKCPSVLVECGFLSNKGEAAMLTDMDYQSKIAFTVFSSTMRFLGVEKSDIS